MQNRSNFDWPTIYFDSSPSWSGNGSLQLSASPLDVYEVSWLHYHRYMELGYCCRGSGICYVEEEAFDFRQGDVQLVFPYQRHLSKSIGQTPSIWKWFTLDPIDTLFRCGYTEIEAIEGWLQHDMGLYGIIDREKYGDVADFLAGMFSPPEDCAEEKAWLAGQLLGLLVALRHASAPLPKVTRPAKYAQALLLPAIDLIEQLLGRGIAPSIAELAAACSMSPAGFRRKFHGAMGISPKEYITVRRMRKARKLLRGSDMQIIEICSAAGYGDISAFNRCFKAFHGISPTAYRKSGMS